MGKVNTSLEAGELTNSGTRASSLQVGEAGRGVLPCMAEAQRGLGPGGASNLPVRMPEDLKAGVLLEGLSEEPLDLTYSPILAEGQISAFCRDWTRETLDSQAQLRGGGSAIFKTGGLSLVPRIPGWSCLSGHLQTPTFRGLGPWGWAHTVSPTSLTHTPRASR